MNNKAVSLSVMMAVLALFFVQSYVESETQALRSRYGSDTMVIKAKRDIKEMETVDETMITIEPVPKKMVEPNAISGADPNDKNGQTLLKRTLVGQVALVPIKTGEQITYNKITEPSLRTGLSPQVQPGKRAISIPVTDITGVSKLVKPGDRVDLIGVLDGGGSRKENRVAKTLLQDVVVLAVGRNVTNNVARVVEADGFSPNGTRVKPLTQDFSFTSVTIEVDPAQAQLLVLVQSQIDTPMSLSLRNTDDQDRPALAGTMLEDVIAEDRARVLRGLATQQQMNAVKR